jgi:hypothetical protein
MWQNQPDKSGVPLLGNPNKTHIFAYQRKTPLPTAENRGLGGVSQKNCLTIGFNVVSLVKFLHASGCIHKLLLAGVEGMAKVANINLHAAFCAACLEHVAASAGDGGNFVFRMKSLFHLSCTPCVNSL